MKEVPGQERVLELLRGGAEVVLGSIREVEPSANQQKSLCKGVVVLDAVKWYLGRGALEVKLPYVYEREGATMRSRLPYYAWPPVEAMGKGQLLLCVFTPEGTNRIPGPLAGLDSVAWPVPNANDRIVVAMKKLIAMGGDRKADDWAQQLATGLKDTEPLVRQYCIEAVYRDVGRHDPSAAVSMLSEHVSRFVDAPPGPSEAYWTMAHMVSLAARTRDERVVEKAIRSLGLAYASAQQSDEVRRRALASLTQLLAGSGNPRAAEVLNEQERARLRSAIEHSARASQWWEEQKAVVLRWLSDG